MRLGYIYTAGTASSVSWRVRRDTHRSPHTAFSRIHVETQASNRIKTSVPVASVIKKKGSEDTYTRQTTLTLTRHDTEVFDFTRQKPEHQHAAAPAKGRRPKHALNLQLGEDSRAPPLGVVSDVLGACRHRTRYGYVERACASHETCGMTPTQPQSHPEKHGETVTCATAA